MLVLHYIAATTGDERNLTYAGEFFQRLGALYDKNPVRFKYFPVHTVRQFLGQMTFEDVLEGATGVRNLSAAFAEAESNRSHRLNLGVALFHGGALKRAAGDEAGCRHRLRQVFDLGTRTEHIRWQLARQESEPVIDRLD